MKGSAIPDGSLSATPLRTWTEGRVGGYFQPRKQLKEGGN